MIRQEVAEIIDFADLPLKTARLLCVYGTWKKRSRYIVVIQWKKEESKISTGWCRSLQKRTFGRRLCCSNGNLRFSRRLIYDHYSTRILCPVTEFIARYHALLCLLYLLAVIIARDWRIPEHSSLRIWSLRAITDSSVSNPRGSVAEKTFDDELRSNETLKRTTLCELNEESREGKEQESERRGTWRSEVPERAGERNNSRLAGTRCSTM